MASFYRLVEYFSQPAGGHKLRLVSRVSLVTGVAAVVMLLISILFLTDQSGNSYAEIIYAHSLTQKHLKPVLLISSLCLLGFVAFITWLITLYSSFKIVGPLYRFSRNLEQASAGGKPLGLRKDDDLQDVSHLLQESITNLQGHYQELDVALHKALDLLDSPDEKDRSELNNELARIRGLVNQVQFDG